MSKLIENKRKMATLTQPKKVTNPICFTQFEQIQTDEQRWKWAKMKNSDIQSPCMTFNAIL